MLCSVVVGLDRRRVQKTTFHFYFYILKKINFCTHTTPKFANSYGFVSMAAFDIAAFRPPSVWVMAELEKDNKFTKVGLWVGIDSTFCCANDDR